jgi:hypothetical protein
MTCKDCQDLIEAFEAENARRDHVIQLMPGIGDDLAQAVLQLTSAEGIYRHDPFIVLRARRNATAWLGVREGAGVDPEEERRQILRGNLMEGHRRAHAAAEKRGYKLDPRIEAAQRRNEECCMGGPRTFGCNC